MFSPILTLKAKTSKIALMMREEALYMIAGIVCEYNPFHNGHLYHIEATKKSGADYIVAVMSGNFVQRGECAFADKWVRAVAAVMCGADVVIDLPTPWSMASAETFARGSIGLLTDFGIDALSFGCENDDIEMLRKCALAADDEKVASILKEKMSRGMKYPEALCGAIACVFGDEYADILSSPNNTLAAEYIRQLSRCSKAVELIAVRRKGAFHDKAEASEDIASASKIRGLDDLMKAKQYIPQKAFAEFMTAYEKGFAPCRIENCEGAILAAARQTDKQDYKLYVTDDTGLADRLYGAAEKAVTIEEITDLAKSKNYTRSRVRRELMNVFLRVRRDYSQGKVPYMKITAVSERGLSLLSAAKESSSVPIITKHSEAQRLTAKAKEIYEAECRNTDLFALMSKEKRVCSVEKTHSLEIVR